MSLLDRYDDDDDDDDCNNNVHTHTHTHVHTYTYEIGCRVLVKLGSDRSESGIGVEKKLAWKVD